MYILEPLVEKVENYAKTSIELYKLKAIDKLSSVISTMVFRGIVAIFLTLFIIVVNFGLALWLGDLLGKYYYGFFCVAGFYFVIGGIVYFFMRKYIRKHIMNSIISKLMN